MVGSLAVLWVSIRNVGPECVFPAIVESRDVVFCN